MKISECIISDYGRSCIYKNPWKERILILVCAKFLELLFNDVKYKLPELKNDFLIDE